MGLPIWYGLQCLFCDFKDAHFVAFTVEKKMKSVKLNPFSFERIKGEKGKKGGERKKKNCQD